MEKQKSDDEEAADDKAADDQPPAKRAIKISAIALGNPELAKLLGKGSKKSKDGTQPIDSKGKAVSKSKADDTKSKDDASDKLKKKPVGRPRKKKETDEERMQKINKETQEALLKMKKNKEEVEKQKKEAKLAEQKRKAEEKAAREAAIQAKKDKLGKGGKAKKAKDPAMKGKSLKQAIHGAFKGRKDESNIASASGDDISPAKPKPSPRSKKPLGSYHSDEDDDDQPVSQNPKPLAYDTPTKEIKPPRKQATPTRVKRSLFKDPNGDHDDDASVVTQTDPDFADLSTALDSKKSLQHPITPNAQQKIFHAAQTERKVMDKLTSLHSNMSNVPIEEIVRVRNVTKGLVDEMHDYTNDTTLSSTELEALMMSIEKRTQKLEKEFKKWDEQAAALKSRTLTSGVTKHIVDDQVKYAMEYIRIDDNFDPSLETEYKEALSDFFRGDKSHAVVQSNIKKLEHSLSKMVGTARREFVGDMLTHVSRREMMANQSKSPSSDTDLTVDKQVEDAMSNWKKDPKYDPTMDKEVEDALRNYYRGDTSDTEADTVKDDERQKDPQRKRNTKEVLIHVLSQILGNGSLPALTDIASQVSKPNKQTEQKVPSKKVKIVNEPVKKDDTDVANNSPKSTDAHITTVDNTVKSTIGSSVPNMSVDDQVEAALRIWRKDPKYDATMEKEVEDALRKYYNGDPLMTDEPDQGQNDESPEDQSNKKRNTRDVLLHVLSKIIGSGNMPALQDIASNVSNKNKEKKTTVPVKKVKIVKDPVRQPPTAVGNSSTLSAAATSDTSNDGDPSTTGIPFPNMSVVQKVQEGMAMWKKDPKYDQSMDEEVERALWKYFSGDKSGSDNDTSTDKQSENEGKKRKLCGIS